jgi:hypothetical protein
MRTDTEANNESQSRSKQTPLKPMRSAFGGKADVALTCLNVRLGPKADIVRLSPYVPLMTKGGHGGVSENRHASGRGVSNKSVLEKSDD